MRKRAEQVDQTRQRIVDAAVHLHRTVGPAATTIAGIAEQAKVTRLTVYRHFPDETTLIEACSAQWLSQQPIPDPEGWARITDPAERLRTGLTELYHFYRVGQDMLTLVNRDRATLPPVHRKVLDDQEKGHRDVLLGAFDVAGADRRRLRAVLGHAVSFWTWRSLCVDQKLSDRDAVELLTALALTASGRMEPTTQHRRAP